LRAPRSVRFSLALLTALLVLWLWLFYAEGAFNTGPNGKAFGGDFAAYYSAAQVMKSGGNPFDHALLYRRESSFLQSQGLPITSMRSVVRVGQPPLFFWALQPLTWVPFGAAAFGWIAFIYLLSAAGFVASLRYAGLGQILPVALFLLMPQVVMCAFYGNVVGIVFAAIGCSLLLIRRHPFAAGVILTVCWLKPQVGLPLVLLMALFGAPSRRRLVAGFAAGTVCMLLCTSLLMSTRELSWWIGGLTGFSGDMTMQPSLACLSGLYVRWAPSTLRLALECLVLLTACVLTAREWFRNRAHGEVAAVGWLWCVWLLATPYAHFPDEILLSVPILAMVARTRDGLTYRLPLVSLYLGFFSLPLTNWYPMQANLLSLPLSGVAVCLLLAGRWNLAHGTASADLAL